MLIEFIVMCQKMYDSRAKAVRFMPISVLTQAPANPARTLIDADELETPHKYGFNEKMLRVCDDPDSGVYSDGDNLVAWILYRDDLHSLVAPDDIESFKNVCFSALILHLSSLVSQKMSEPLQYGTVSRNLQRYWSNFDEYVEQTESLEIPDLSDPISNAEAITVFIRDFCSMAETELREKVTGRSGTKPPHDNIALLDDGQEVQDQFGKKYSAPLNTLQQDLLEEMMQSYRNSADNDNATIVGSDDEMIPMEIRVKMLDTIEHFEIEEDISKTGFGENKQSSKECPECHSNYVLNSGLGQMTCMECDYVWNIVVDELIVTDEMKAGYEEKIRIRKEQSENLHGSDNPKSIKRIKKDNDT